MGDRPEVLIEMRQVSVRYGKNILLDGLDWTVRAGESWALLGPNGSGKTTLLGLISGDHPQAFANDIRVFGQRLGAGESTWERKRQIGWVSPELHLHFPGALSCLDAVVSGIRDSIGLYEAPLPNETRAARNWLKQFGMQSLAQEPFANLSLGLQRMVLLARALVKQPRLLLLDEPCQGLDLPHRRNFLDTLDAVLAPGKETALYVTHQEMPMGIGRVLRLGGAGR